MATSDLNMLVEVICDWFACQHKLLQRLMLFEKSAKN